MKKTLRLLLFKDCNRTCPGCCNHDWDLEALPVADSLAGYDEVILTGGEPLLDTDLVVKMALGAYGMGAKVYLYTACSVPKLILKVLHVVDGLTLTLHEQADVEPFEKLCRVLTESDVAYKSMRLNVFKDIVFTDCPPAYWTVKKDMEWIVNCPLPENEVLMRLPQLTLKGPK